jgi:hypothetical protein
MPRIELIPEVFYNAMDPYHWEFDNLPLENILSRQRLVNDAVDINSDILRDSVGTAGTLANRMNQSIEADGSLKTVAVDDTLHNIAMHEDGSIDISGTPVNFVRMLESERDKLSLINDEATSLTLELETISATVLFENETVKFVDSSTVAWSVNAPNEVSANFNFPAAAAHQHFYDLTPVASNIVTPDYINYKVTSVSTPYTSGSLRIFINGVKISESGSVYVPDSTGPDGVWTLTTFTSNFSSGTFALNRAITSSDVIRIDFDTAY